MDNLNAKAANKKTKAKICRGVPFKKVGSWAKLIVPVVPYTIEIPNNKMPDEKADDKINFIAASEDRFLSRSKLAIAATGIVASSSDKKNISRLPLEIIKNIPSRAESISIKNSGKCSDLFNQSENNKEIRYTPKFKIFFWKIINEVLLYMPPNNIPSWLKKNPAMKFSNSKTCIISSNESFFMPFPILINSKRKMIKVISNSGFIIVKRSLIQSLFIMASQFFS